MVDAEQTEDDPEPLAPVAEGLARGTAVERFLILGELGAGGMGVVYEAYDPQLDRRVAIKIVRRDRRRGAVAEARLAREARAMARLSAREVVAVFDVGTHAGSTFIAMELVDGESLERRLQRTAEPAEVLRWLVDAGRGLAAAHDAGIVHRDFKPANVLISRDGRAKVTDFGLAIADDTPIGRPEDGSSDRNMVGDARGAGDRDAGATAARGDERDAGATAARGAGERDVGATAARGAGERGAGDRDAGAMAARGAAWGAGDRRGGQDKELTQTGALLGTPRYMAPEQVDGVVGPASDQFAFAVTAWRALGGSDPFGEELGAARTAAIDAGRLQPSSREIAKPLRQALVRALAAEPAERWPSMHELVARLDRRGSSWLSLAAGASAAAIASVAITLAVRGNATPAEPDCAAAGSLAGTWDDDARGKLAATLAPLATTGDRVRDALDAYARRWAAARVDACEDTRVRRTQSDEAMDLRMSCLDERRRDLAALLAATAQGAPTPKLVDAAFALPPVERCARVDLLRLTGEPQDPEARRRAGELRDRLREAKVSYDLARYADGKPIVDRALAAATELRADALRAEALYWQGRFIGQLGDAATSETTLRSAVRTGEAARADEIVAHARTALVFVIALQQKEFGRVDAWVADAEAAIARIGGDAALTARLHLNRGAVLETGSGRSKEALEEFRAAEAGYRALAGGKDDPDVARALTNAGTSLWTMRRLDEAEATMVRALAIYEASFGDRHPQIGQTLLNLSGVARGRGDRPAAVGYAQRAVQVLTASLGPSHPTTAAALGNLGHTLFFAGRDDDALATYQRSQATLRANKANPATIAQANIVIANIYARRGKLAEAEQMLDEAQELYDRTFGAESPDAQIPRLSRAEIRIGKKVLAGVAAELDKVAAVLAVTPDPRLAPYVTRDRGLLASAEGRRAEAIALLESVAEASYLDATDAAETHVGLAKALVASPAASPVERERARTLARRARAAYAAAEGEQGRNVTELDTWLAALK